MRHPPAVASPAQDGRSSPPGIDLAALDAYLPSVIGGGTAGPLSAQILPGGRSNLTFLLSDGRQTWVLRRPPLGHVLETAHDMAREHRVMSALKGSVVPVPTMVALCRDPDVLGAPFYVMSYISGTVFRSTEQLSALSGEDAARTSEALVRALVGLHTTDVSQVGLADLGRPQGYLQRQVGRWAKQLDSTHTRQLYGVQQLGERLKASIPNGSRATLVHGDYKLDNVVMDATTPGRLLAVLDWEMATLGDPITDLVNLVIWWDGVRDVNGDAFAAVPADMAGFPASSVLVESYRNLSALDLQALPWYLGLAYFKLAAIFEGMYYREAQGLTPSDDLDRLAGLAPALGQRGHQVLDGRL